MSLLSIDDYDLSSATGQSGALQDVIEELNRQYSQSTTLKTINIAAFGKATINVSGAFLSTLSTKVLHNLGFAPAFQVYVFDSTTNSYLPLIAGSVGVSVSTKLGFAGPCWATSDTKNLNIYMLLNDLGIPATVTFAYWIFNLPMPT